MDSFDQPLGITCRAAGTGAVNIVAAIADQDVALFGCVAWCACGLWIIGVAIPSAAEKVVKFTAFYPVSPGPAEKPQRSRRIPAIQNIRSPQPLIHPCGGDAKIVMSFLTICVSINA